MCNCVNIDVATYANQIDLPMPPHMVEFRTRQRSGLTIDELPVDKCLAEEVQHLWSLGITTTGCCCGHNKLEGYIGVVDEDISRMKELGYVVHNNPNRPGDEDSFIPKMWIKNQRPEMMNEATNNA